MPSEADPNRGARKDEHLSLALAQLDEAERPSNDFDDLEFLHHALAGIDADDVDLSVGLGALSWNAPFFLNGMTGGTERTDRVNRELAIATRETGIAMGVGSVSVALDDPASAAGFRAVRDENPDGIVFANIGADRTADDALRAVDLLRADALQVHLNAVQETAMPEGSRMLSGRLRSVAAIVSASPVPVIVKEVGFGLSRRTLEQLRDAGVRYADVGGRGGTDFLRIENARRKDRAGYPFLAGFGQSTPACLIDAPTDGPQLIASGGVRHPLDVVKALALGARAVGVAGAFLRPAADGGAAALIERIRTWQTQTAGLMSLLGAAAPVDLQHTDLLLRGRLGEYCRLRGVDPTEFASRSTRNENA